MLPIKPLFVKYAQDSMLDTGIDFIAIKMIYTHTDVVDLYTMYMQNKQAKTNWFRYDTDYTEDNGRSRGSRSQPPIKMANIATKIHVFVISRWINYHESQNDKELSGAWRGSHLYPLEMKSRQFQTRSTLPLTQNPIQAPERYDSWWHNNYIFCESINFVLRIIIKPWKHEVLLTQAGQLLVLTTKGYHRSITQLSTSKIELKHTLIIVFCQQVQKLFGSDGFILNKSFYSSLHSTISNSFFSCVIVFIVISFCLSYWISKPGNYFQSRIYIQQWMRFPMCFLENSVPAILLRKSSTRRLVATLPYETLSSILE